jgi:asparagine synthase (glutamine-hydrolysing)
VRALPAARGAGPQEAGVSSPLPYLLRDEYRWLFHCFLEDSRLARDGILLQAGIDALLAEHEAGKADHGNRLWLLVNSEAWYRMRILGQSATELAERIAGTEEPPALRRSA